MAFGLVLHSGPHPQPQPHPHPHPYPHCPNPNPDIPQIFIPIPIPSYHPHAYPHPHSQTPKTRSWTPCLKLCAEVPQNCFLWTFLVSQRGGAFPRWSNPTPLSPPHLDLPPPTPSPPPSSSISISNPCPKLAPIWNPVGIVHLRIEFPASNTRITIPFLIYPSSPPAKVFRYIRMGRDPGGGFKLNGGNSSHIFAKLVAMTQ